MMSFYEQKRDERIINALENIAESLYVLAKCHGYYEDSAKLEKPKRGNG